MLYIVIDYIVYMYIKYYITEEVICQKRKWIKPNVLMAKTFYTLCGNSSPANGFWGRGWREWWRRKDSMRKIRKDHFASCIVCALKLQSTGRCDSQAWGRHSVRNFCHVSLYLSTAPSLSLTLRYSPGA